MKPLKAFIALPVAVLALGATTIASNAATSYYSSISSSASGSSLASSLHSLISSNTKVISYSNLYSAAYPTTDCLPGTNIVWDIYSNEIYNLSSDAGSSATAEGAGFNREHTVPQSWFAKATPMVSDIYHIYPTDVYVNNQRSSYMYDDVSSASKTFNNGSKLGTGTIYNSKTTFEIADEYKGDIARGYFYMAIRYSDKLSSWTAGEAQNVFTSSYPYLTSKAISVFTKWAHEDPVSDKEMLRNEATYALQNNRNPFIDNPAWVDKIWSNSYTDTKTNTEYSLSNVNSAIAALSSSSSDDQVYTAYNKYCRLTVSDKASVTNSAKLFNLVETKSKTSTDLDSFWANTISSYNQNYNGGSGAGSGSGSGSGSTTQNGAYNKVLSASSLSKGDKLVIAYDSDSVAMSTTQNTSNRGSTSVSISSNSISEIGSSVQVVTLENGQTSGSYRLSTGSGKYLTLSSDANKLTTSSNTDSSVDWIISVSSSGTTIKSAKYTSRYLQYNATSKVFAAYKSTQKNVSLYKEGSTSSGGNTQTDYTPSFKAQTTNAKLNLSYTKSNSGSSTTSNTVTKSSFSSISASLDSYISYQASKGSSSTNPGVYSNIIRVYQNGGTFKISASNGAKITSVTLGSQMSTKVTYSIDGGSASGTKSITANGTLAVSGINATSNVLFTCKGTSSSQRLYVNYLAVTYQVGSTSSEVTYTFSNVSMDFGGVISKSLYNSLVAQGSSVSFGVRVKRGNESYTNYTITPTACDASGNTSSNGSYMKIYKNVAVSSSYYSTSYTAQTYVVIDGETYYMNSTSYSVDSLVAYYIANAEALGVSADLLKALKAW